MKLTSLIAGCAVLLVGVQGSSHIKRVEHRELLRRKRSQQTSHGIDIKVNGIIKTTDNSCGGVGATHDVTATTGPNGSLKWLNCGIDGKDGWNPPYVAVKDVVSVDLNDALKDSNSPFQPCAQYAWAFNKASQEHNVPSIFLAAFALQESTCNPKAVGGMGEQGLMQLTKDKCPHDGDCKDIWYNVNAGAKYFSSLLDQFGGNLLLAIGNYNGWHKGMTYHDATDATDCRAQNNLDYIVQFVNGWILNVNAYDPVHPLGLYFNLKKCGQ